MTFLTTTRGHLPRQDMRLLLVVPNYYPDRAGGALVFADMARAFRQRGHQVTVRCAVPYYPEWRDKAGQNGVRIIREDHDGVSVERFGVVIPSNPRALIPRLLFEASFLASLCRRLDGRRFDVIIAFSHQMGGVAYAVLLKALSGPRVLLNVQDLAAEAAVSSGIANGRVGKALRGVQRWLFGKCDLWTSISPGMVDQLELIPGHRPTRLVPNWLNESAATHIARVRREPPRSGSRTRFVYAGNIGAKQGLAELCERFRQSDEAFEFHIHGDGGARRDLEHWMDLARDDRFTLGPLLEEEAFIEELARSDWLVIPERATAGAWFVPSKLIPSISVGCPIFAVNDGSSPLHREVKDHGLGISVLWSQVEGAITEAVAGNTSYRTSCLQRAAAYDRDRLIEQLEEELLGLAGQRSDDPA